MPTFSAKPTDVKRAWHLIDASEAPLGRLTTKVATLLTGKEKPMFTKHIDTGDFVVVVNAEKLVVTGDKLNKKVYNRHSGFPGGITSTQLKHQMAKDPTQVVYHAVRGMLPVNKLRNGRLKRLKIYAGPTHEHDAQKPAKIDLKEIR
jgi:large subunit ribosomal protein L13